MGARARTRGYEPMQEVHNVAKRIKNQPVVELKVYPGAHQSFDNSMQGPYYAEGDLRVLHTERGTLGRATIRSARSPSSTSISVRRGEVRSPAASLPSAPRTEGQG